MEEEEYGSERRYRHHLFVNLHQLMRLAEEDQSDNSNSSNTTSNTNTTTNTTTNTNTIANTHNNSSSSSNSTSQNPTSFNSLRTKRKFIQRTKSPSPHKLMLTSGFNNNSQYSSVFSSIFTPIVIHNYLLCNGYVKTAHELEKVLFLMHQNNRQLNSSELIDEYNIATAANNHSSSVINITFKDIVNNINKLDLSEILRNQRNAFGPVEKINDRLLIMTRIRSGEINQSIFSLKELFPNVFENNTDVKFGLLSQRFIELIRTKKIKDALLFARSELSELALMNNKYYEVTMDLVSLLAYEDPFTCPAKYLFEETRREEITQLVNRAIMESQGLSGKSILDTICSQLTAQIVMYSEMERIANKFTISRMANLSLINSNSSDNKKDNRSGTMKFVSPFNQSQPSNNANSTLINNALKKFISESNK